MLKKKQGGIERKKKQEGRKLEKLTKGGETEAIKSLINAPAAKNRGGAPLTKKKARKKGWGEGPSTEQSKNQVIVAGCSCEKRNVKQGGTVMKLGAATRDHKKQPVSGKKTMTGRG